MDWWESDVRNGDSKQGTAPPPPPPPPHLLDREGAVDAGAVHLLALKNRGGRRARRRL